MSGRSSRAPEAALAALAVLIGACSRSPSGGAGTGNGDGTGARKGEPVRIAAAADLALAFKEESAAFEQATGKKTEMSFGSTGALAKQISEGAPYDVLAAANVSYVDDVVKSGACLGETKRLYARGRIVMWTKDKDGPLPATLAGLDDAKYAKVAIANPDHAPYGKAAQQALEKSGAWAKVQPRTVFGENVQQAQMFAQSGNAEVAIIALSLALTSGGHYVLIDESLHAPLDQAMVVCRGGAQGGKANEARAFVDFVASEPGRVIMRKYGFLLPGEAL